MNREEMLKAACELFLQGVGQGYLLGEAYYERFEQLFWQNAMAGSRSAASKSCG